MISGTTRVAAVLGWPVEHSRSPQIINAAFHASNVDAVMVPMGVAPEGLAAVIGGLRGIAALGASVTSPHKVAVAALCDQLSAAAQAIGAVNCLELSRGRLIGHNTDAQGFLDGLVAAGFAPSGARVVVLGAGGAARAIAHALRSAATVEVFAREPARAEWVNALPWTDAGLNAAFCRANLIVDCTPVAFGSADEAAWLERLPLDALASSAWVATLVYHRPTKLIERARSRGHSTLDGRAMLVHQGARAFTIWTGIAAPIDVMTRALDDALDDAPGGT